MEDFTYISKTQTKANFSQSVLSFTCVYFRSTDLRFFSLSRRRRAELNKSAAICSLKIKFEANQHKSSNVLHRRCSSFFFFV